MTDELEKAEKEAGAELRVWFGGYSRSGKRGEPTLNSALPSSKKVVI